MRLTRLISLAVASAGLGACVSAPDIDNFTGEYLAGRFAVHQNEIEAAADAYARAHAEKPQRIEILRDAFFFRLAAGDVDEAAVYARKLLATDDGADDGLARIVLAAQAIKAGRYRAARTELAGDMDAQLLKSVAFLLNVWIEAELNGVPAALQKIENPGSDVFAGFSPLHRAFLLEKAGRMDDARAAHQASVLGLGGPVGRAAYGAFLERAGDAEAAREYYQLLAGERGAARRIAADGLARLERGEIAAAYAKMDARKAAAVVFYGFAGAVIEQAADQRIRAEEAGFNVGAPRYTFPLALARVAVYLGPDFSDARNLVGTILNIYGDHGGASAVLAAIAPSSPHYEQARISMARALAIDDQMDDAISLLENAIRRDPDSVELRLTLANFYSSEGLDDKAVKTLTRLIDRSEDDPNAERWRFFVSRGAAYIELDRWDLAEADLKAAVELAPEEPTALNYLGYSWAERGINLDEAFALIEKAVELQPQSGAIVDSLGWAHYQLGHYEEAVGHLERAAGLEPSDPTICDHLGDAYWRLGRKIEARYQWRRSLELEPSEDQEKRIREKLEKGLAEPTAQNSER